jgi:acyl dehydratase
MAIAEVKGIEGLKALLGKEIGPSEWREVNQEDIDMFAELSGDEQGIHVDVERAKRESPFGIDDRARQLDVVADRRLSP